MISRFILIIILIVSYKYIPVFEPIGINYLISLFLLGAIAIEVKKIWVKLKVNEFKKNKIQKIGYFSILFGIFLILILGIHKDNPAGNIRYVRIVFILITIVLGSKIIKEIVNSGLPNFIKNTFLILYSTATFIAVIEIGFMFFSLSHGSGEAYSGKIWGTRYWNPINQFGFRDKIPKKGKKTIIFVGDSFTAGWGVKKIEDRFSEVTAKELKNKGKKINEINIGKYGADTKLEFHLFENFIKKTAIKPNHIVLQYFVNDMDKFILSNKACLSTPPVESKWKKTLIEGSYLFNYLNSLYPTSSESKDKLPSECDYIEQLKYVYKSDSIWKKEEKQLDKFKNYCLKNKIALTIVFFPFMEDLNLAKKLNIENRIEIYCKKNRIKLLNTSSLLIHLPRNKRQVSIMDSHASDKVHKIVGKKLATIIKI